MAPAEFDLGVSEGGEKPSSVPVSQGLLALQEALGDWMISGQGERIASWLAEELDPDGVPWRLPVPEWAEGLRLLASGHERRPGLWPDAFDPAAEGWFRALLRFSRPGGSSAFGPGGLADRRSLRRLLRGWAERLSDPALQTVVDWWFPRDVEGRHSPPPLPADSRPDRPLAVLRANWARDGDFVAVDHRQPGPTTRFELFGRGRAWLGPRWTTAGPDGTLSTPPESAAAPGLWVSQGSADASEWSYRVGPARVVRTSVLLRGRRLALVAEQWDGPGDPGAMRLGLADGVTASPLTDCRGLLLAAHRGRSTARVLAIGLPETPDPAVAGVGELAVQGREVVLTRTAAGPERRCWRVLLVSWDARRNRRPVRWRPLTVSEDSEVCTPDVAAAVRVSWGPGETLLIYRSLARPGLRAFLGHQSRARFLVALFTPEGEVEPLLTVEN